jgi:two-component system sensor histidine kinase TctE
MLMQENKNAYPSMRQRLLSGMAAVYLCVLAILSIGIWGYAREAANKSYDRLLHGAALSILERTYMTDNGVSVDLPYSAFETVGLARNDRVFYRIYTENKKHVTGDPKLVAHMQYSPSDEPFYFDSWYTGAQVRFILQARFLTGENQSGWAIVQIGHTRQARDALQQELVFKGILVAFFITTIGLFLVWFAVNKALHPLIGIERNLRERDPTDFTPLDAIPPREVFSLISSINTFMNRLQNSLSHSQDFIADMAHQTRTALSTLQGQLDLATHETDPDQMRTRLRKADLQARRTIRLTNQILSHAMVIHRADNQNMQLMSLRTLTTQTLEKFIREQIKADIDFEVHFAPFAPHQDDIIGDPISLREALRNILDNAIKHGPRQNKIDIHLFPTPNSITLCIDDKGPGIPDTRKHKVLERFFTSSERSHGSGLGMSIVHAVANSHNATLHLEDTPAGGLRVKLVFPCPITTEATP